MAPEFLIGLALLAAALYALSRLKTKDLADAAHALGFAPVAGASTVSGHTPEGRPCRDTVVAQGTLDGFAATLVSRSIPNVMTPRSERVASLFTVLTVQLPSPPAAILRLQPVGWSRGLEAVTQSPPQIVPTGDAPFDAAWHLYTDDPTAALVLLNADFRAALIAWRAACVPDGPEWSTHANSTFLLGSFAVTTDRAEYALFGSPLRKTGEHVAKAAPLLTRLTGLG